MITVAKELLSKSEEDKVRAVFTLPGFEILIDTVRAKLAAHEAEYAVLAVEAERAYWSTKTAKERDDMLTKAAELKIFLNVVDAVRAEGYEFFRVKLTA